GIHGLLLKLHEALTDRDCRSAALTCQDIVWDLGQECMLATAENDLLQMSSLFSKDYGLLSFLRKSLPSDELKETRVKSLCFLGTFLDKVSYKVKGWENTYAMDLKDTCMVVYVKDKGAKCRTTVMELLIKVLQITKASSVAAYFKISEMFDKFYGELFQRNKLPDSLGKIYELLGVLAEVHPSEMVNNSDKLYRAYLGELKEQMTSSTKEPKLFVVAGCLIGITAVMVNFTKTMEEPATCKEIFQFALKAVNPQMAMSRYAVTFGLRLLAKHASQFSSCLIDNYKVLFEVMSKLCGHINGEMKKTSYFALEAFLKQVALLVAENTEEHKSKLKFFMQKFCGIIKTMDSTHKELSIAIRGYGFFAAPCKKVCPQDVDLMYTELIQRCKQMYLTESDDEDDSYYQLPSFLDSIASVLIHLDKIPEVYTPLLERLLVVQIDSFPQYSDKMQTACCRSILKVFVAMASKGPVLWSFIGSVGKWKVPLSENYLDLFRGLLDCDQLKSRLLYDELVKSILRIVEKLDLSVQKLNTDEESQAPDAAAHILPSSDPTAHLVPNKVKDFTAFINLVEFCKLLRTKHVEYFQSWMYPLSHELILHSIHNPLVSGFYKLLALTMKIAKRIKYFQGVGVRNAASPEADSVKLTCFALFSKFGKEVCVRLKQYKDELLSSCLTFVLSLHHNIVALDVKAYCPALEAALKLGLSHAPLANTALDALEDWSFHIPLETLQPCYTNILPLLDGYLKNTSGSEDAPLVAVRLRVVKLLGRLGGKLNRNLVTVSSEEMMKKFVAWDTERRLSFAVPFTDMKPVIYLDPFLPRISELALSTSDRQTKVAACELLHSLVVYMVGKSAQMVEGKSALPPMYKLHKRLFPVLLRLACDVDQVTRQLFEPLVMQLIHWFTNNKKFESQDTVAVLEAILDGVVDPMDSTLRDFCGRCIEEFVKWSIKQTTPKQQEKSPTNMKSLFKRIYSLALHPNGYKRLGSALAFNSIYRHFEENSLVEQFVFEVLVIFVESLALAHSDERSMTLQQCKTAIDHLKRIIKHKAPSLNQRNAKRRIPRGFPPDEKLLLSDVVLWLLEQCGRPQTDCRHKCMELFYEFVPLLPGKPSPPQWMDSMLKDHGIHFLTSRFEGGGLLAQPTLRDLTGPFSVRATLQWMDLLLAALDCYNTFISTKDESSFLKAIHFFLTELVTQDLAAAQSCFPVHERVSHFSPREVDQYNYSKCTITVRLLEFATMVLVKGDKELLKILEPDVFCTVFFELTALAVCEPAAVGFNMADIEVMRNLPEVCVALLKALVSSTHWTHLESSLQTKISRKVEQLCAVDLYSSGSLGSHVQVEMLLSSCKQIHRAGFLDSILHGQDADYVKSLGSRLLMTVYKGIAPGDDRKGLPSLDVNTRRVADGLLQLSFALSQQSEQLVDLLLNTISLSVTMSGSNSQNVLNFSHGEYFYSLFQTTVNAELLKRLQIAVPCLVNASSRNPAMVSALLNGMLDHSFRERSLRKTQGKQLVEEVLKMWKSLQPWWEGPSATPDSKTATLLLLSKLLQQIDSSVCSDVNHDAFRPVFTTFTVLLMDTNLPLNFKSQALLVLPFLTTLPEEPLAELQKALDVLVVSHFPMQSDEFTKGSLHRNNYMDCVRKLLDALELSQSPLVLKLLSGILCRDRKHIMEEQFQICFQRLAKVPVNHMLQALTSRVLLPLASHCGAAALNDFFVANVSDIIALLLSRFTKLSETAFEVQLLKKNCCYKLMELLYSRLPKEEVYSKDSRINRAHCRADKTEGNELSKALIRSCFEAFTENMAGETQLLELRRQYHCAAYNCAIAVISCCFSEAKFFNGFLFSEKPEKQNQFILENLIDVDRSYNFPVEIEVPLERKKKYIMIRSEVNEDNGAPVYLSSQSYMADSSLSEEMSQFDFSTGVQSFSFSSQNPEGRRRVPAKRETEDRSPSTDAMVDLEMDELNQHECMAAMIALVEHMQRNNITPKSEQGNPPSELPPWMKFLHVKLSNPATPLNIRLFVAKLVINTEEVFRQYSKHWLGPLLQLVVSEKNGGVGIHFMVVDIVVTVLSWTSLASPKGNPRDEVLANRLFEFLIKNSFHSKKAVFRHNLEIIRTMVECWKDCLHVPYVIFDRFCGSDPNGKDNSVGLQLLGIILANKLPAYDISCGIEYYIQSLTNNLSFVRYKDVYSAAAEIIGLILKNMADNERQQLLSLAASKITNLQKKNLDDKFIICLNKVSKHFPPFMDFMNHVFFMLPKLHGVLKTDCLECVLSRAEVIPDVFMQLKTSGFVQMMSHDEARQRMCLDIIHKILGLLTPLQLQELTGAVTAFVSHPSPVCRERMYDILMWIQDNYDAESMEDSTSVEILNAAKETLLQGLAEENQGLLYVRNFWSQEKRLPTATLDRMLTVLQSLYSCQIERCFLSLATNLLLEMTSQSPDFNRNMFEYPLSECTFQANEQRKSILRLRRRFLKDQEKVSVNFARREIQQQKQKKEDNLDQRLRKEAQVTLYRSYRVGDFPDIQIPYNSLITPLQALAQRDPILAKQLFSSLFAGILEEMEKGKVRESSRIKDELRLNLNTILSKSTLCFPPFVACVQDICHQQPELQQLDPATISSTSLMSLQQPSGILLLEESLLHSTVQDEPPSKRARGRRENPPDTNKWIHLALYRSLEDYDVVRGIFGGKVGTKSITCDALQAEANTDFAEAVKLYNEAINTEDWADGEPTNAERDFWEIAAMEAYSHLTEWKSLQYCSTVSIDENTPPSLEKMWSEPLYQEMYLQHMIRSMLKQLQQGERDQSLLSFIDQAMKVEEHKKLLESHYSQELSLLYILQEDFDRAKYYIKRAMELFIESYSSVDTLLTQSRLTVLQSVQSLIEIQDFLHFITGESVTGVKRLTRSWTERYPDAKVDPLSVWDDIITSRCFFLDKIREKLRGHAPLPDSMEVDSGEDPASGVETLINDCKFNMKLQMANSAQKQNNFAVATKLLKELHKEAKADRSLFMPWVHSFSRYSHKRSHTQGPVEQISSILKTVPLLDLQSECQRATAKTFRNQKILQGTSFNILAKAVSSSPSILGTIDPQKEVEVGLQVRALKLICEATGKAEEELQSYTRDCVESSSITETYMALANFCDELLRDAEQSDDSQFPDLLALPVHVVDCLLKSLKMNSEEARLKFPRLLQIIHLYPSETLDLMTKEVPCWMLIGWISQMVALLDKPEAVALQHSIGQIAESYPQALVYALMISTESFQFEDTATGHQQREFVDLRGVLDKAGAVRKFVDALQQLTNPEMIFRDWWDYVKNQMDKPGFDKKQMERMYDEMRTSLGDDAVGHGAFRKKFIQRFAKDVEKLLGSKGGKLFEKRKDRNFVQQVEELAKNMREFQREPGNLKEYSPWLSSFKADAFSNELEIPQYDGRSKPLPEYHAKITGFDERVKVMSSIRRPKRLIIRGDDERDHPFLVKGGEDLRQDQRIEQLFSVMNILLSHDSTCARRGLELRTYQVIPITTRIGLIEWMENTSTLKEFLCSTLTEGEQKKAKRADTVNNFGKVLQHVPRDLLRAFLKMCNSPEAFLSLRSHFISSHALLCVSHWILGIGDRHLLNFMINMETGGMIGIDFGHAFGSATQFLPVPELMPFRLTGQFVNLMRPLSESGLVQSVMVHSLRAFRAEPDLLLNTMDVFVKEPSLDWKNFELKQLKKGGTWTEDVNTKEINWYPLQKVNFARRKLEGANPATITEELKLGFEKDPAFQGMQAAALGTPEHNIRAKLPAAGLSVEKQVDCLIDQATDPNVLGRVWAGWEPGF
uniref:DNA-dependent protein kinase catalytic subunit n=1 Tax=Cynoglossus semilaevis TaxID=244447 RepID=A0A3P8W2M6_CYNSE